MKIENYIFNKVFLLDYLVSLILIKKTVFEQNLVDAIKILKGKSAVIDINEDLIVAGDLHGDWNTIQRMKELRKDHDIELMLFLGDYVDRGTQQIEVVNELCELIVTNLSKIVTLRGNHEDLRICNRYGFKDQLKQHNMSDLWELIGSFFAELPLMAIQQKNIMFTHGGIPGKETHHPVDINKITKQGSSIPFGKNIESQIVWNDPFEAFKVGERTHPQGNNQLFDYNPRGIGALSYSKYAVEEVLNKYDLRTLVRGHIALKEGYKWYNEYVLSLHSSSSGVYSQNKKGFAICRLDQEIQPLRE